MNILDISKNHGNEMYVLALEHAINMFEMAGDRALPMLKNKLDEKRKELDEAEACSE